MAQFALARGGVPAIHSEPVFPLGETYLDRYDGRGWIYLKANEDMTAGRLATPIAPFDEDNLTAQAAGTRVIRNGGATFKADFAKVNFSAAHNERAMGHVHGATGVGGGQGQRCVVLGVNSNTELAVQWIGANARPDGSLRTALITSSDITFYINWLARLTPAATTSINPPPVTAVWQQDIDEDMYGWGQYCGDGVVDCSEGIVAHSPLFPSATSGEANDDYVGVGSEARAAPFATANCAMDAAGIVSATLHCNFMIGGIPFNPEGGYAGSYEHPSL